MPPERKHSSASSLVESTLQNLLAIQVMLASVLRKGTLALRNKRTIPTPIQSQSQDLLRYIRAALTLSFLGEGDSKFSSTDAVRFCGV